MKHTSTWEVVEPGPGKASWPEIKTMDGVLIGKAIRLGDAIDIAYAHNSQPAVVAMLKSFEWTWNRYGDIVCLMCERHQEFGHRSDCKLAALIAEEKV